MLKTYQEWIDFLNKGRDKTSRKTDNNTYVIKQEGYIAVKLHNTEVVKIYPDNTYELNAGSWYSVTTKDRINSYSPVRIYQKDYSWYVMQGNNEDVSFRNGIKVNQNGTIIN